MNLISLGLDIPSFDEGKKRILNEYIDLFNKLERWDGHVFNPVMGGGLTDFNNSVTLSTKLLDELNIKIEALNAVTNSSRVSNSNAAKSQTELSLAVQEYNKLADNAAKISAKLSAATSDQAKETMALKLNLSEVSKALLDTAKNTQSALQQQIAYSTGLQQDTKYQAENNAMKMQAVNSLRELAVQQDRTEKEYNKVWAAAEREKQALSGVNAEQTRLLQNAIDKKLREEGEAAKALARDYDILRKSLIEQQNAYSLAYRTKGKDSPEAASALNEYKATASIVGDIDKNLGKATGSSKLFGGALSSAFSSLRTIAYILPGIGIAGIFNLAFEAIGKATENLDLFGNKLEAYLKYQTDINKALSDQISLNEHLYTLQQSLDKVSSPVDQFNRLTGLKQSEGVDPVTLARRKFEQSSSDVIKTEAEIAARGNSPETLGKDLEKRLSVITDYANKIKTISDIITELEDPNRRANQLQRNRRLGLPIGAVRIGQNASPDALKKEKDELETKRKVLEDSYIIDKGFYDKSITANKDFFDSRAELQKLEADQQRKLTTETTKEDISLRIQANEKILNQEISSEKARIDAMRSIAEEKKSSNLADLNNVLNNNSSTSADKGIAQNKYSVENAKIDIKLEDDIFKLREQYRQRFLKATTEIKKDEVEQNAISNEKIYKNEEETLTNRLIAYDRYLTRKQTLQDLEYALAKEALSLKANDPTARKELAALESSRDTMKSNIQADAEAQTYNIVSTSLKKELQVVLDANNKQAEVNEKAYAEELNRYNKLFENKKVTLKDYIREVKIINDKYKVSGLDEAIVDDKSDISRLNSYLTKSRSARDAASNRVEIAKNELSQDPKNLDKKRDLDEAVGEYKARDKDVLDGEKALQIKLKELDDDELKRARAKTDELIDLDEKRKKKRQELINVIINIEQELYNAVVSIASKNEAVQEEKLQQRQRTVDEGYESEISAIEKSSLTAKDKTALDVQLNQKKLESDKAAERKRLQMRHDEAEFEKELSISQIIIATSLAIMKAAPNVLLQIEAGVTGGIALAEAVSTQIPPVPAYEHGTKGRPHPGGLARTGEKGKPEVVFEPYKSPYLVLTDNISYLPAGTEVVPVKDSPDFSMPYKDTSWEQTRWLAAQMKNNNIKIKNNTVVNIDLGSEVWRKQILGN